MLLPIKPIIDRRPRRNGTSVISIQYCYSSDKRTLLYTGLAVPPRYWNKKLLRISQDLPEKYGKADQLNLQVQKMVRTAEDIVNFALQKKMDDPVAFLKKMFQADFDPATLSERAKLLAEAGADQATANLDFFYQLDDYIPSTRNGAGSGTYLYWAVSPDCVSPILTGSSRMISGKACYTKSRGSRIIGSSYPYVLRHTIY
jgi:hypothetical protein